MKHLVLGLVLLAPPLAACETVPTLSTHQTLADERALLAAEAAYQGALIAANAAVDSGALKGERAAKAADLLQRAKNGLDTARRTKATADAFSVLSAVADIKETIR